MPEKTPPPGRGTSTRSRGKERSETVRATGSSDATIIVSVRNVLRPTPASTPRISTLIRPQSASRSGTARASATARGGARSEARERRRQGCRGRLPGSRRSCVLGEDVIRALAHGLAHDAGVCLRRGHQDDERDDRQRVAQAEPRQPPIGERRSRAPGAASRARRPRRASTRTRTRSSRSAPTSWSVVVATSTPATKGGEKDEGEAEERGQAKPSGDEVPEARHEDREQGRDVPAAREAGAVFGAGDRRCGLSHGGRAYQMLAARPPVVRLMRPHEGQARCLAMLRGRRAPGRTHEDARLTGSGAGPMLASCSGDACAGSEHPTPRSPRRVATRSSRHSPSPADHSSHGPSPLECRGPARKGTHRT